MEAVTFNDLALLLIATMALSMTFGGLAFWVITAIKDCKENEK
jgi:hypothetical protein